MKYELLIRSRAKAEEDIATKHLRFIERLSQLEAPWGGDIRRAPQAPDPGAELIAETDFSAFFMTDVLARVAYQFRRPFRDEGAADDWFSLRFDPTKLDYQSLASTGFAAYVEAFGAYRGEMGNAEFAFTDFDEALDFDDRWGVCRIYPVSFFDTQLCSRAFRLSPVDVVNKVTAICERAELLGDGVLIIGSSRVLAPAEGRRLMTTLTKTLKDQGAIEDSGQ